MVCCAQISDPQPRARPPRFDPADLDGVFFEDLERVVKADRPRLGIRRKSATVSPTADGSSGPPAKAGTWSQWISAASLEDEIKRVRLQFEQSITTPSAFRSGGYQDARLHLTVLATLFAIVGDYDKNVRWQEDGPAARDVLARTARNANSGTIQVFNETKLRVADLQDLVSGTSLASEPDDQENDWSLIADRVPLMMYADQLLADLEDSARSAQDSRDNVDDVKREAELLAVLGKVLTQEGMDDFDDPDYAEYSDAMTAASAKIGQMIRGDDFGSIRKQVGAVSQTCAKCHEDYR